MKITFPDVETWDIDQDAVVFPAFVDDRKVICAIAWEAIQDGFGNEGDPLEVFREHRWEVENVAEKLLQEGRFEKDGSILIRSVDVGV